MSILGCGYICSLIWPSSIELAVVACVHECVRERHTWPFVFIWPSSIELAVVACVHECVRERHTWPFVFIWPFTIELAVVAWCVGEFSSEGSQSTISFNIEQFT